MPWLKLSHEIRLGDFVIETIKVQESERFGIDPAVVNSAINPFRINREISIREFTYVGKENELLIELNEDELNRFKFLHELLVISGLTNRQFFNPFLYCNTDQFDYYIKNLVGENSFTTISGRRRDGNSQTIISDEALTIVRPAHVPSTIIPFRVNQNLIISLLEANEGLRDREWYKIYNSILNYNKSNTDNTKISLVQESILMRSAFELLLSENNLVDDFELRISDYVELKHIREYPELSQREANQDVQADWSIAKVWMKEFSFVRDVLAHGNDITNYNLRWPLREHLLLASFIYPAILKRRLSELSIAEVTPYDQIHFTAFEELCTVKHLVEYGEEINQPGFRFPWNEIFGRYLFDLNWQRMQENQNDDK